MKNFTFFLCAVFLSSLGFSQGTANFANLTNATGGGNGISSSYQGWTSTDGTIDVLDAEYYINFTGTDGAIQNLNNPSGNDGYADYTGDEDKIVIIYEGMPIEVTATIEDSGELVNVGAWVDLNHDGVFGTAPVDNTAESGYEQIQTISNFSDGEVVVVVPGVGFQAGNDYRVRLQVRKSATDPNNITFTDGETEDYLVRVLEQEICEEPYNSNAATSDVYISSIEIAGIGIDAGNPDYDFNYTSNDMSANGYGVIDNPILTIYPGLESTYTVSSGPTGNSNQYYYSVWIDFNHDGCFDSDEQVIWSDDVIWGGGIPNGEPGVEDVPYTFGDLIPGFYQARIRNSMMDHPMAEGNGDGEALDFTVEVITEEDARRLLGIESHVFNNFTYYPNPVKNQLTLNASSPIEQVEVYSLIGQKVIQKQPNALEASLATDQLQAGVYLMSVTIDGSQKTFRVVKE